MQLDALTEPDDRVAVFYLDLDNFKLVNDSLGHAAGDEVLQEIARRLDGITPAGSSIGRIGGDEFVIVSPLSSDHADTIERQSRRVHDAVSGPISLGARSERLTISIGVVVAGLGDSRSPTDLLRDADIALYQAKMEAIRRRRTCVSASRTARTCSGVSGSSRTCGRPCSPTRRACASTTNRW